MVRSKGAGTGRSSKATHEISADRKRKKVVTSSPTSSATPSEDEEAPPSPRPTRKFTFLPSRFRTRHKQQRFLDLEGRQIIAERPVVEMLPLLDFSHEYQRRKWTKLGEPEEKYNESIIREFFANAFPIRPDCKDRVSWVRGKIIPYDPVAINTYLETEYTIPEQDDYRKLMRTTMDEEMSTLMLETLSLPGSQYQTGTKSQPTHILRADLKSLVRLWQAFLYSNVVPLTHTSDITISKAKLIFCILLQKDVDIATLISDEIHAIVLSKPSKSGAVRPLAFPGLITGLCKAKGVMIPQPLVPIRRKIDHLFVNARCYNQREFPRASRRSRPPPTQTPPPAPSPPVPPTGSFDLSDMQACMMQQFQRMEEQHQLEMAHLRHVQLQQAANHRGQVALHSYFYHYTQNQASTGESLYPWPTPEQFQDVILWPGDSPVFSGGGGEQHEQPHLGEQGQRTDAEIEQEGNDGAEDSEEGFGDEGSLSPTF